MKIENLGIASELDGYVAKINQQMVTVQNSHCVSLSSFDGRVTSTEVGLPESVFSEVKQIFLNKLQSQREKILKEVEKL